MARRRAATLLAALVLVARAGSAALVLEVSADSEVRGDTAVRVTAANVGDEPAHALVPDVSFLGTTVRGERVDELSLRFSHTWELTLPRPPGAGTFPLVVELRYADAFGHASSAPIVHVVRTPGTAVPPLALVLEAETVASSGHARVRLTNLDPTPLDGVLRVIAGTDLAVTPVEAPVAVAPRGSVELALALENRGALPGSTVPLYAYVTTPRSDRHDTVVATASVAIVDASPLAVTSSPVVLVSLVVAGLGVLVALALRRTTGRGGASPRAARRR